MVDEKHDHAPDAGDFLFRRARHAHRFREFRVMDILYHRVAADIRGAGLSKRKLGRFAPAESPGIVVGVEVQIIFGCIKITVSFLVLLLFPARVEGVVGV